MMDLEIEMVGSNNPEQFNNLFNMTLPFIYMFSYLQWIIAALVQCDMKVVILHNASCTAHMEDWFI